MILETFYEPVEHLDHLLGGPLGSAPLPIVLALAALLGLRHALDPDHLVAVTSLVAARRGDVRAGARIGAWWGLGHAGALLAVGVPLVLAHGALPAGVTAVAERAIGVVIALLGVRLLWRWRRDELRLTQHVHPPAAPHRHVHRDGRHTHHGRTPMQALGVGTLHGLAGSGAVVVLLLAALDDTRTMLAALVLFAAMTVVSMALCTAVFSWVLTRPRVERMTQRVLVPGLALFAIWFGAVYAAA